MKCGLFYFVNVKCVRKRDHISIHQIVFQWIRVRVFFKNTQYKRGRIAYNNETFWSKLVK